MFHIRTKDSTHLHPDTYCGSKPEISEPKLQGPHWQLTEWDWVKAVAEGHPGICQDCVRLIIGDPLADEDVEPPPF